MDDKETSGGEVSEENPPEVEDEREGVRDCRRRRRGGECVSRGLRDSGGHGGKCSLTLPCRN